MENIRDPDLRQMVEAFKQDSATVLNYHRLALGQAVFDQMYGKRFKENAKEEDEPNVQALTLLKGCRRLLINVCRRIMQLLDEPQDAIPTVSEVPSPQPESTIVDARYTIKEEPPAPTSGKAPAWDN